jgi:NAD(P)-dependent dehydrogenase (short-subunit alcohol dehydrogenase family)
VQVVSQDFLPTRQEPCRGHYSQAMPSVLVTGASRGIGNAIVTRLIADGWDVFAGVRTERDAGRLVRVSPRLTPVILDVTNSEDVAALGHLLPEELDALVNNAGVVVGGPMEAIAPEDFRRQFDVNLVGHIAVTQAVLPRLRKSKGRIVFISSALGKVAVPMLGAYCASKFALEAAADALRLELRTWDIRVVVVEPAQTDTDMWRTANTLVDETLAAMSPRTRELYAGHLEQFRRAIPKTQRTAVTPDKVAGVVVHALTARRPSVRYPVGTTTKLQLTVAAKLPTAIRDGLLGG